jgi:hypothetical protein
MKLEKQLKEVLKIESVISINIPIAENLNDQEKLKYLSIRISRLLN